MYASADVEDAVLSLRFELCGTSFETKGRGKWDLDWRHRIALREAMVTLDTIENSIVKVPALRMILLRWLPKYQEKLKSESRGINMPMSP